MVIEDLSYRPLKSEKEFVPARPMIRLLAGTLDLLLLSPLVSFVPAYHMREARLDYAQGFDSTIWFQIVILAFLTFIVLLTGFTYFFRATPGQAVLNLRIKTMGSAMTWNQALLRSLFYVLSWLLAGLPLLESVSHALGRCWHDRISDTMVVEPSRKQRFLSGLLGVHHWNHERLKSLARLYMVLGFFVLFLFSISLVGNIDSMQWMGVKTESEQIDTVVAKALLKKDNSDETRSEIEEKLWSARSSHEKALAYFYRFQQEKKEDVRKALSSQICEWKVKSLCMLTEYEIEPTNEKLTELVIQAQKPIFLSAQVALMRELTKQAKVTIALNIYDKLKNEMDLRDELKIWDVSLFIKIKNQKKQDRFPASEKLEKALADYEKERGEP